MSTRPAPVRCAGDGGAAVAEFALMLPFLAMFVFGVIDFGNAYRQENLLEGGVMTAARTNTQLARNTSADFQTLRSISETFGNMKGVTLTKVIVWKANTSNNVPANCLNLPVIATANGIPGSCNVYSPAQVTSASEVTGFGRPLGATACTTSNWDTNWCPMGRVNADGQGDYLGVYIEMTYAPLTKFAFTGTITMSEQVIYRLEPPYIGGL